LDQILNASTKDIKILQTDLYANHFSFHIISLTNFHMNLESNPIDLQRLKQLIHNGMQAIPADKENS